MVAFWRIQDEQAEEESRRRRNERTREWRGANPERTKELSRAGQKKWRAENLEKVREQENARYANNREHYKAVRKAWRQANSEHMKVHYRKVYFKQKYNLTIEERDAMLTAQGGCAGCRTTEPGNKNGWQIDHCHKTGKIRGILCHHCNAALGNVKDNIETLQKLIAYLEKHTQ